MTSHNHSAVSSPSPAIETVCLSKTFGRGERTVQAVVDLDLSVPSGQVFGFLGPNGAGKSTTIRMLMDLIRPTAGQAMFFGQSVRDLNARRRAGALVEGAVFYPFMTARDNLAVLGRSAHDYQPERIEELLETVGLADRAGQRVSGFSTGMKQRLGLAAALLSDPDLLILDEPTNGLDPAGIQEMRGCIRDLAREHGKTVFLSSHLLNEVEQVCDRVAIIHRGRLLREGPVGELLGGDLHELQLQVHPLQAALEALAPDRKAERLERGSALPWLRVEADARQAPAVVARMVQHGVEVHQVIQRRQTLEDFFISITNGGEGAGDA
ncbi:MAG: ABC transporter ATP-binding protein [Anaerolineales bacterium]